MIRSGIEEIERDADAAYRRDGEGRLKQAIAPTIGAMASAVNSYLETASALLSAQEQPKLRSSLHTQNAYRSVDSAWAVEDVGTKRASQQSAL